MRIGIVVFDEFTDLDFYLPWDLLNRVRLLGLAPDWKVEILADQTAVASQSGLSLTPTQAYEYANECDAVLFCSGPKTRTLLAEQTFLSKFKLNSERQILAAIDSGALILAALNLLEGKLATTYPSAFPELERLGAIPSYRAFVEVGNIATASRCLSGTELAMWMIRKLTHSDVADAVYETVKPL